jgi:TM2 domain-containing membrane protein YozV
MKKQSKANIIFTIEILLIIIVVLVISAASKTLYSYLFRNGNIEYSLGFITDAILVLAAIIAYNWRKNS